MRLIDSIQEDVAVRRRGPRAGAVRRPTPGEARTSSLGPALLAMAFASVAACTETTTLPSEYGDACAGVGCRSSLLCVEDTQFPGGYCTSVCSDGMCPTGADCADAFSPPVCLGRCSSAADCRDGYQCWRGNCRPLCGRDSDCGTGGVTCGTDMRCVGPECGTDSECSPTQRCADGRCVPRPDAGDGFPTGAACTADDQCSSDICLPAAGGVCSALCTSANDCFEFSFAAGCSAVPTDTNGDGSADAAPTYCVSFPAGSAPIARACSADDDCNARICQDGQCTEVCASATDCVRGQTCTTLVREGAGGASFTGCGYTPLGGATVIEEITLPEQELTAGFVFPFDLAIPSDAVSLTIQAERRSGDPLTLSFAEVSDPLGTTIFDLADIGMLIDTPIRWIPDDGNEAIAMLIPNTTPDRVAFIGGQYEWTAGPFARFMGDTGMARFSTTALIKRSPGGVAVGGPLNLNIALVGIGVNAAQAPTNTRLQNALARLANRLSAASITLGTIRYFDLSPSDTSRFQIIDTTDGPTSELADMFRTTRSISGRALNVFLVRSIEDGGGAVAALGVAGGLPGPVGIHGTGDSGIAVVFDAAVVGGGMAGSNVIGHVMAHEIGHYLGLFHVTERLRACQPGETPVADNCSAFGGADTLVDTTYGDMTNLMHWVIIGTGSNSTLSNGQQFVLRVSPLIEP